MSDSSSLDTAGFDTLKIFQWNCRSLTSKIDVAASLFTEYDVLVLSETWLTRISHISLGKFLIFQKDFLSPHAGLSLPYI